MPQWTPTFYLQKILNHLHKLFWLFSCQCEKFDGNHFSKLMIRGMIYFFYSEENRLILVNVRNQEDIWTRTNIWIKFYFRPQGIIISIRCVGTVLCKVWGSFPGIQKNRDLDVFPVSVCLIVSTTAVAPWSRVRPIASDPVGHNSRAPVAVYVFV